MPVIPDCHGSVYSRFGSKPGCFWTSTRLVMFVITSLSSFSAQPFLDHERRYCSLSVRTMMSLLIDWPRESGPWIFPKYSEFELMSSV